MMIACIIWDFTQAMSWRLLAMVLRTICPSAKGSEDGRGNTFTPTCLDGKSNTASNPVWERVNPMEPNML